MTLKSLKEFAPNYIDEFDGNDIIGFNVYAEQSGEKVGSITDVLVDETGHFRYFIVDFGLWIFNKQVMFPVGRSRIDYAAQRIYFLGMTRKQVETFPAYTADSLVDDAYEAQIKEQYSNDDAIAVTENVPKVENNIYTSDSELYTLDEQSHQFLKQYQDRLITKSRNTQPERSSQIIEAVKTQPTTQPEVSATKNIQRSACLIFNPVAGQSDSEQDLSLIKSILQPSFELDIRMTTPDKDADEIAREAVTQGAKMIIASGGDGTLSAAAEAVVGTGIPLGVISRGTANAFATALGIPTAIEAACQTIVDGKTRIVDAAYCNGKPMVLLAGIGFEAETVERADREAKNRFGMLAYVLAGIQELRNFESFEAQIETEDKVISLNAAAITVANAAPPTSVLAQGPAELLVDDGLLDVTIVAPTNTLGAIAAAYNLLQSAYSGEVADRPDTGFIRARKIKVTTNPPQKVVVDGELVGQTPLDIECLPGGLTIVVPSVPEEEVKEKLDGLPNLRIERKDAGSN